ncbi:MAG: A/G-specific adenine glycosylase [Planctomycetales bacterium]|nr:A/G-specific adenine glycosylase [Planctomycetales bacterium]NIM10102.1 A/G-specific adenine glycosylase [Planctomycetales bacterium]NIN09545.1 A/G-specific adenine glycosylase [Planctomycetales bacterium]NIN78656.1 A/G-specific adenine glycosylase [Planctomycetales bacterium]NIO35845.1 A/G-specific adenine glycosylase [Planctomycetales bacterium]
MSVSSLTDTRWRSNFRRRLRAWYKRQARDLPWRRSREPYQVWISEIMLQQTQVSTVRPYFQRFIRSFPNIASLAAADEQDVLRHWEGLGYYRRARQLHRAAQQVVAEFGGQLPREPDRLRTLPGIGPYTAGAILSIAFDAREPILEANTTRLLARLLAYRGDVGSAAGQRTLWALAAALLPRKDVGRFNQALMELGSLVCKPRAPACNACPVRTWCGSAAHGLQDQIPKAARKTAYEEIREAAVIIRRRGRVLLRRCGPDERWSGLWDFPRVPLSAGDPAALAGELTRKVHRLTGVIAAEHRHLKTIKHGVTRFRITLECFEAAYVENAASQPHISPQKWLWPKQLPSYPLNSTGRKLAGLVAGHPPPAGQAARGQRTNPRRRAYAP